jgi:ATP-dependent helicase/nuclease subunit A
MEFNMSLSRTESLKKFVRAGAGAGKTWNLTRQVIEFALDFQNKEDRWPRVILTTFTRKATQELKERMLLYCMEEKPEALEFVQSSSFLTITTMHGLFNLFLSRHGQVMGLPSQIKIVEATQGRFWRKQILRDLSADLQKYKYLSFFDFKRLLKNLITYESVYWTQDVRAVAKAQELQQLMDELLKPITQSFEEILVEGPSTEPGPAWEDSFLQLKALVDSLKSGGDWASQREEIEQAVSSFSKPRKSKKNPGLTEALNESLTSQMKSLQRLLEADFSARVWEERIQTLQEFEDFAQKFMKQLTEKKRQEGALETNDLEFYSYWIVKKYPQVLQRFSESLDGWFIDEFQDTSPLQIDILKPMMADRFRYLVGDPQQSIYLFRGSRSEVFLGMQEEMKEQQAEMQFLQKNYRSQEGLLRFFNEFFPAVDSGFSPMEATKPKELDQSPVQVTEWDGEDSEAEMKFLSQRLLALLERGVSPKEIALLTRTHGQIEKLQKFLTKKGFPIISHASSQFHQRREVLDGRALLKFLINPWDDKNLISILRSPWLALEDAEILALIGERKRQFWPAIRDFFSQQEKKHPGQSILRALKIVPKVGYAVTFRRLLIELKLFDECQRLDPTGRSEANLWKLVNQVEKLAREPGRSLIQFISEGSLSSSLEDIGDAGDAHSPSEPNKIHLMTVHASKGLQFEYVFMPFLHKKPQETRFQDFTLDSMRKRWSLRVPVTEERIWSGGPLESLYIQDIKKREREESLRVLYVGMTRAKIQLHLSWTGEPEKLSWAESISQQVAGLQEKSFLDYRNNPTLSDVSVSWSGEDCPLHEPYKKGPIEFLDFSNDKEDTLHLAFSASDDRGRRHGVLFHKLFEILKEHGEEKARELGSLWLPDQTEVWGGAIDYLMALTDPPLKDIFKDGFIEWGYQRLDEQGRKLERRIDLWGLARDQLWIVDYKTGTTQNKDKAFEQMQEYAQALKDYLNWEKEIQLVAIFPLAQQSFTETWEVSTRE